MAKAKKVWTSSSVAPSPSGPQAFGRSFDVEFQKATVGLGPGEIGLFEALADSLRKASVGFRVEEYHGNAHQVTFAGDGVHSRSNARCELSDLLIIVYSPPTQSARFTFLQAKSERAIPPTPSTWAYHANLEQWDLLARRPDISSVTQNFTPPRDLLSGSLMPSIGSFGIFYQTAKQGYQTLYASADCLRPSIVHAVRRGRVVPHGASALRTLSGLKERTFTWGNYYFARDLYGLKIGEPLLVKGQLNPTPGAKWLARIIGGFSNVSLGAGSNRPLLDSLVRLLGESDSPMSNPKFGAKRMILIENNDQIEPSDHGLSNTTPDGETDPQKR